MWGPHLARNCTVKKVRRIQVNYDENEVIKPKSDDPVGMKTLMETNKIDQGSNTEKLTLKVNVDGKNKNHEVTIKLQNNDIKCIIDSGSEITVLHKNLLPKCFEQPCGRIHLKSAFGQSIEAEVLSLPLRLVLHEDDGRQSPDINTLITVAVTPDLDAGLQCLLTPADYELLNDEYMQNKLVTDGAAETEFDDGEEDEDKMDLTNNMDDEQMLMMEIDDRITKRIAVTTQMEIPEKSHKYDDTHKQKSRVVELHNAQKADETLIECFKVATEGDEKFYCRQLDGLLFHVGQILGRTVQQLVLPKDRREDVMRLGHDVEWAGHMAAEKTYQRIGVSFFWPNMKKEITDYCKSCNSCQLKRRKTCWDRVPISPVLRPEHAFEVMNFDIIGPIANKSRGYAYVLTCIDQCSRWPEAVPIRNLHAKTICESLLWIFAHTGIPKILVADNASYNTAKLTEEFMRRLGVTPRFSTPFHPEGNAVIERYNAVIKGMIHHAIRSGTKEWHKLLPFILWAYRESPNATTGVSPFELIYGRPARGILTVLRETWIGEQVFPSNLPESTTTYLKKLKENLDIAKSIAAENTRKNQQRYTDRYNLRSRSKVFDEGDPVIILMPDSNHKVYSRWMGPAKIRKKISDNSYDVEMEDGSIRRLHANHLRKYQQRTNAVGIVYEADEEFGDLEYTPISSTTNPENNHGKFQEIDLSHLSEEQRKDILKILEKHHEVFSDKPGKCDSSIAEHVIKVNLRPDEWPKQSRPYRVPPILRNEVDRQVKELLQDDMIQPSVSPIAHPIVCVLKQDNSIRLCCDNRYINSITEGDSFPMRQMDEVLDRVGAANYITGLDATAGYWQISVDVKSRPYTSFVTHSGAFQWKRLNFGLKNAAATYQRAMEKILQPHAEIATAYIDDVSIYSMTWNDHLQHLDEVLQTIQVSGFKLRLRKCKFAQKQVKLLGQIVGGGKRRVDPAKVEAILKIRTPTTKKEIQSFLGMMNFYRVFIPELSKQALCLTELTKGKKANNIVLNQEQIRTFENLKKILTTAPILATPNFDGKTPFIVQCDASNESVAACLAQVQRDELERPIAYASAKLTETQTRWSTIEKESFAVIFGLRRFETYLIGSPVIIYTDHNPLTYIVECSPKSARLTRWALSLQKFHIIAVKHKRGSENTNVDALSRLMTINDDFGGISTNKICTVDKKSGCNSPIEAGSIPVKKFDNVSTQTPKWLSPYPPDDKKRTIYEENADNESDGTRSC